MENLRTQVPFGTPDAMEDNFNKNMDSNRKSVRDRRQTSMNNLETIEGVLVDQFKKSEIDVDKDGAKDIHVKAHPTKNKKEAYEFLFEANKKLMTYNEDNLENYEPEKEHNQCQKYSRKALAFIIFGSLLLYILFGSINKYGTEKIQVVSTKMNNDFFYDMEHYPPRKLLPLH